MLDWPHFVRYVLKRKRGIQACANPKLFLGPWNHYQVSTHYVSYFFVEFSVGYRLIRLVKCIQLKTSQRNKSHKNKVAFPSMGID